MKTALLLILLSAITANAQTNYGFITFTNKARHLIERAEVYKVDALRAYYRVTQGAGGGSVMIAELSSSDQKRFGFDADLAAAVQKAEDKVKAAKREQAQRAADDAKIATAIQEIISRPPPNWDSETVVAKITEKNSSWWRVSYIITIKNPDDSAVTRDYETKFLDRQGFVLETSRNYNITTAAHSTNLIRGYTMISVPTAFDVEKTEVVASKRK